MTKVSEAAAARDAAREAVIQSLEYALNEGRRSMPFYGAITKVVEAREVYADVLKVWCDAVDQERREEKWVQVWGSSHIPSDLSHEDEKNLDLLIECERQAVERDYGR